VKRSRTIASAVILSATIAGSLLLASPANAADVTFADPALQACANQMLNQPATAPVSTTQAASLTGLYCQNAGITNLGGIENFTSLDNLTLTNNSITDLTPVSSLTTLTALDVGGNQVTDISPISGLTGLTYVSLYRNQISDLSPVSSLTNILDIAFFNNEVVDLAPLASLPKLRSVTASDNNIVDLSPLSGVNTLVGLDVSGNDITDLSPLSGLPALEGITADNNDISDLSGLTNLPSLDGISIEGNHLFDLSPLGLIAAEFDKLHQVHARFQILTLPDVIVGQSTPNPLRGGRGELVTNVMSATFDPNFVLATDGASWTYTVPATNELYVVQAYPGDEKPAWQLTGFITQNSIAAPVFPTTLVDDTATTTVNTSMTIDVLANDGLAGEPALDPASLTLLDADGNPAAQVAVTGGTFEVVDGAIVFTPTADFTGTVPTVTYQVTNADGVTGLASIRVTVTTSVIPTTGPTANPTTTPTTGTPSTGITGTGTPASSTGFLASTGFDSTLIVVFGGLAAAAGALLFAAARRRRRA
jgi:Leucine-rich repeat (LRR) protein